MEECGVIEIFGYIEDADALREVARSAKWNDMGLDWHSRSSEAEIVDAILAASENGEWVRLMKDECGTFEQTRLACQAAGLSYIHSRGVSGGDGYDTAAYWTKGQDKEFVAGLVNGMDAAIPYREIHEASRRGTLDLRELITNFGLNTLVHLKKEIKLSPECEEELRSSRPAP